MRSFITFVLICALGAAAKGQDRHDWQSLAQLQAGDRIRLTLKTGRVDDVFQSWTAQTVTAGTATAKKEDVLRIERYRRSGGRAKNAAVGALIGFAGGFAAGAAVGGCHANQLGPCFSRGLTGALGGGAGAVIGAGIGALLPGRARELIYSAR